MREKGGSFTYYQLELPFDDAVKSKPGELTFIVSQFNYDLFKRFHTRILKSVIFRDDLLKLLPEIIDIYVGQ